MSHRQRGLLCNAENPTSLQMTASTKRNSMLADLLAMTALQQSSDNTISQVQLRAHADCSFLMHAPRQAQLLRLATH